MTIVYGIICAAALAMVGVCFVVDRKRDVCLFLLSISIFLCDLGFFLISAAQDLNFALHANRLAYLGQVFLPLLLLNMILDLCGMKKPRGLLPALAVLGAAMFAVVASPGIFPWYYKTVSLEIADDADRILREYGPLHLAYYVYLFGYLAADTAVIVLAVRKKRLRSGQQAFLLLAAVYAHVVIWLVEQFLPRNFEYLSVSYVMTETFVLLMYSMAQEYELLGQSGKPAPPREQELPAAQPEAGPIIAFTPENIERIFQTCGELASFTDREADVLRGLLADKRRKDIAGELFLSESSIKKYTAQIFRKLSVESRKELFASMAKYI